MEVILESQSEDLNGDSSGRGEGENEAGDANVEEGDADDEDNEERVGVGMDVNKVIVKVDEKKIDEKVDKN